MKNKDIQRELCEKHQLLTLSDYVDNKISEAMAFGTEEELAEMKTKYRDVVANRKAWRARINELEQMTPEPDDEKQA